jgi:signal transduction histidine kinase
MRKHRRDTEARIDELQMFAARVAHDVRSPLMPALLALQRVATKTSQDDPTYALVQRGEHSLRAIASIVEGLLRFATAGAAPEPEAASSLRDAIDDVLAEFLDEAIERKVELVSEYQHDCRVGCARGVLVSIVGNLVANAIKYMGDTPADRRVVVRATAGRRRVLIEVSDSGPGLQPGTERRIFEPYVRLGTGKKGIGLGLATVKRLVDAHGGCVGAGGRAPRGSVFWVELPTVPAAHVIVIDEATSTRRRPVQP